MRSKRAAPESIMSGSGALNCVTVSFSKIIGNVADCCVIAKYCEVNLC